MANIFKILRCAIILLIADSAMVNFRVLARAMATVAKSFESNGVVPDIIPSAPAALATVSIFWLPVYVERAGLKKSTWVGLYLPHFYFSFLHIPVFRFLLMWVSISSASCVDKFNYACSAVSTLRVGGFYTNKMRSAHVFWVVPNARSKVDART